MSAQGDDMLLDDDARDLLSAMREETAMPPDLHDRVWARVERSVSPASVPPAAPWRRVAIVGLAAAAAIVAIAGLWDRRTAMATQDTPPRDQAAYEREDARGSVETAADASAGKGTRREESGTTIGDPIAAEGAAGEIASSGASSPAREPGATASEKDGSSARATTRATKPRAAREASAGAASSSTLAQEIAAIEKIRAALLADAPARALEHVRAHARRFPDGALVQEREALHAVALCTMGHASGKARAEAFEVTHPQSPLVTKVRAACTSNSAPKSEAP